MPVQRLKVAILPLDVPCCGPVTHSGKILTTGKSHGKKPDRFALNDNEILNDNNIKISVITESKKRNCKERKRLNTIRNLYQFVINAYTDGITLKVRKIVVSVSACHLM